MQHKKGIFGVSCHSQEPSIQREEKKVTINPKKIKCHFVRCLSPTEVQPFLSEPTFPCEMPVPVTRVLQNTCWLLTSMKEGLALKICITCFATYCKIILNWKRETADGW